MVDQQRIYVSAEEYMERYAADFYEWVDGELIPREGSPQVSPISALHVRMQNYLNDLFRNYLSFRPLGDVLVAPFVMRLGANRREPDLQVILKANPGQLTETEMIGAADICVEIVSPESVERDYADKFREYEQGGVREYWIVDLKRKDCQFYRLNDKGTYTHIHADAERNYTTPMLPRFKLHLPTLWVEKLPDPPAVTDAVRAMLADEPS